MSSDTSKYKNLDQVIQKINSKYITPADETARQYVDSFQDFFNSFRKVLYDFAPVLKSYKKVNFIFITFRI